MRARALVLVGALAGPLLTVPVAPAHAFVPPNFQPAVRVSWSGTWSTTYGPMHLVQIGRYISGGYTYSSPAVVGHLTGEVEGSTLRLRWVEGAGGAGSGDAWFILSADGKSFQGSWVKDGDVKAPNAWVGWRTQ
jgi:hypothetical protein